MTLPSRSRHILSLLTVLVCLAGCATPGVETPPETLPSDDAFQRGVAALTKGTYDQAIVYFTESLKRDPQRVEAYHNRGEAYRLKGEYDQGGDYARLRPSIRCAKAYYARGIVQTTRAYDDPGRLCRLCPRAELSGSCVTVASPIRDDVTMIGPLPTIVSPDP
jgi:tetratricopeptide (TPR) repeat protein